MELHPHQAVVVNTPGAGAMANQTKGIIKRSPMIGHPSNSARPNMTKYYGPAGSD
jgi:hypothetical protein